GGEARKAVENKENVQSPLAQRGSVRDGDASGANAFLRAAIAGRADDRGTPVAAIDPQLRFAAALADERDDDSIRGAAVHDRLHEGRLPGTGPSENPDARSAADRQQRVDDPHSGPEASANRRAFARARSVKLQRNGAAAKRLPAVERRPACVDCAAERARTQCKAL